MGIEPAVMKHVAEMVSGTAYLLSLLSTARTKWVSLEWPPERERGWNAGHAVGSRPEEY